MNIHSDFRTENNSGASITMQHYIFAFVQDVVNQPDNMQRSKKWLKEYCEKERMNYSDLEHNMDAFFQLLGEYRKTGTSFLYRFLKLQAQACYISEERFDLLRISAATNDFSTEALNTDSYDSETISSANDSGIVGGHIIGL